MHGSAGVLLGPAITPSTLDPFFFVNVLLAGLVLLSFASTVADLFAFWCLGGGQSTVLRNKRCKKARRAACNADPPLPPSTPLLWAFSDVVSLWPFCPSRCYERPAW